MRFGTRRGAVPLTGAEAAAQILVLHTGGDNTLVAWSLAPDLELLEESDMAELGYPSRARGRYLCRRLGTPLPLPAHWTADALPPSPPNTPLGAPRVLSWQQLGRRVRLSSRPLIDRMRRWSTVGGVPCHRFAYLLIKRRAPSRQVQPDVH